MRIAAAVACAAFTLSLVPTAAAAPGFPVAHTLPRLPLAHDGVEQESFGKLEVVLREKAEIKAGRTWLGYLVYDKAWGDDPRDALAGIVREMETGGWETLLRDEPRVPPMATLRLKRGGRELWARVEVFEQARLAIVETGVPITRIKLPPPDLASSARAASGDFPLLPRFPGSQLLADAAGEKRYRAPAGTGRLEIVVAYRDGLKEAGWQVEAEDTEVDTQEPSVTARYAAGGVDLVARVQAKARDNVYTVALEEGAR